MLKIGLHLACYPELEETWSYLPPLGLGYLSSYTKHHVPGVDFVVERRIEDLIAHRPDIVGITYVTHNAFLANLEAEKVKEALGCPVIVGGPHISTLPDRLEDSYDIAVLGEGEETFADLVRLYLDRKKFDPSDLRNIPGLLYRDEAGNFQKTIPRSSISDLDTVPYPDRDLMFDRWREPRLHKPVELQIMTSRGCPYDCSFCSTIIHWGRGFRYPSNQYVVDEISLMREKYDPKTIHIYDDLYVTNKSRVLEINRMLRERGLHEGTDFICFVRSNLLDDELMESLAMTNFKTLHIGFESGSDEILLKFNKQAANMTKNRQAIDLARKHGLEMTSCFILGAPGETRRDILDTFDFVASSMDVLQYVHFTPLILFPGTKVWDWGREKFGVSATNLKGVVIEPGDVGDHESYMDYCNKQLPYFNEENIPREEFNTYVDTGSLLAKMVSQSYFVRQQLKQSDARSYSAEHIAKNAPLTGIVQAKVRRRLKKLMPTDHRILEEAEATPDNSSGC